MRSAAAVLFAAIVVAAPAAQGADAPPTPHELRRIDRTGGDFAKHVSNLARETAGRLRAGEGAPAFGAPAAIPGWTITKIGDTVFLQDDGTHACDGDLSNEWFESCMAGTNAALEAFYAAYPDANPEFVSFYLAWDINAFFAFYSPVANDVSGIGTPKHGNVNGLNGLIFMNSVDLYSSYGPSYREFLFDMIWGQEFGHRWGAFVRFIDEDGNASKELLGRDDSHWSYFLDSDWSWMEGNDWRDNGGGSFTTNFNTFGQPGYGYSQLDLYLMGLIPPSGVEDFFFIRDPDTSIDPEDPPQITYGDEETVHGKRVWVGIDQVIEAEGERIPTYRYTPRSWQVANLVILRSTDTLSETLKSDMADYTEWSSTHFSRDTFDLGFVDTSIGTPAPNTAPVASVVAPAEAKEKGDAVVLDASGTVDADGDKLSYVWDFGDGTADYTTGATVEHVFRADGDLTVTVVAVDARGETHSASSPITVAKADKKGGSDSPIGCSVSGLGTGAVPAASVLLLALAGALAFAIRRPRYE